jgi:hypothetical protein
LFPLIEDTEVVQAEMKEGQMAYLLSKFRYLSFLHLCFFLLTQRGTEKEIEGWHSFPTVSSSFSKLSSLLEEGKTSTDVEVAGQMILEAV